MQKLTDNSVLNINHRMQLKVSPQSSSRILYDIPCKVCTDHSSGKHYGIFACDGCAGFFKRSIRRNRQYVCKAKIEGSCIVDKTHRNQCRACRLAKCQEAGMNKDAVQHERGPRNSTIRRQMAIYFKDNNDMIQTPASNSSNIRSSIFDLAITKNPSMIFPCLNISNSILSSNMTPSTTVNNTNQLYNPFTYAKLPLPFTSRFLFSPSLNIETVCESAARLLFMNVKWTKNLPAFTSLPISDQLLLLEESWRELFILGTAQFLLPIDLATLLQISPTLTKSNNNDKYNSEFFNEIKLFQETLYKFAQLQIDANEYAFLRAIVLFKTNLDNSILPSSNSSTSSTSNDSINISIKTLTEITKILNIHEQTQLALNKYITSAHPGQPLRFGKILLLLPSLRLISNHTIEELFFRQTIGSIPIEKIISDMYKSTIN